MLSIQYHAYNQLMAADEYSEKRKNLYKYVKNSSTMRNSEMISIDKMLNYEIGAPDIKAEDSADEDEISVGCPSPIAPKHDDDEDKKLARSPSCSSDSSLPGHCQRSSDSYYACKSEKSDENRASDVDSSRRFSSSDEDAKEEPEEYFKPLKRLKMMKIDKTSYSISERSKSNLNKRLYRHNHKVSSLISPVDESSEDGCTQTPGGVKSFSICDILSHKPSKSAPSSSKIVRPWDCEPQEEPASPYLIPPPAHRGILPQPPLFLSQFHPQQIALHLRSVKSEDMSSAYESCSSSGRSSTGGSDCCTSPDVLNCSVPNASSIPGSQHQTHRSRNAESTARSKNTNGKSTNSSPLDALFQMTNKTFDELNGDPNAGECQLMYMVLGCVLQYRFDGIDLWSVLLARFSIDLN